MRTRFSWYAVAGLVLVAVSLQAQTPDQRRALQLFRDSLLLSHDTTTLHTWEAAGIAQAKQHRDDAILHLRLGFLALRINELSGNHDRLEDAGSEFEWATALRPDWPYPWFGVGLTEAREPDRARGFAGGLWTMLGIDRDRRAGAAFAQALHADPSFTEGLIAFAETAREQRIGAPVDAALDALRTVQATPLGWDPTLLLERGRLERLAGNYDSAIVVLQRALHVTPDPAMVWLELARTLPLGSDTLLARTGQRPGDVAYFSGAASDDPEVVAGYRRDLQPIVDDSTLKEFDALRGNTRPAWLQNFWAQRAAADLRGSSDRLQEHFRRWDYARRFFRLPPFRRVYRWGIETYQSHDDELDDRGIIWMRQGAPTTRLVWSPSQPREHASDALPRTSWQPFGDTRADATTQRLFGPQRLRPGSVIIDPPVGETPTYGNETWRYVRPEGDVTLHFTATEDPADYRLVESVLQLNVSFDALARETVNVPGLRGLLYGGPETRALLANEDRIHGKRNIAVATTTASWFRYYPVTMGGRLQVLSGGARGGKELVHLVYAVSTQALRALQPDPRTGVIRVRVRSVFLDSAGKAVATLDTLQPMRAFRIGGEFIAARAEVAVPPGVRTVRFNIEGSPQIGALFPPDTVTVPDPAANTLTASDVMLGVRGRSLGWVYGRDTVLIDAQGSYSPADTLHAWLEVYGLHAGSSYTMQLHLVRQRGLVARLLSGHRESITLTEQLPATGPTMALARALTLAALEPGSYELDVTLSGAGERVTRRRGLIITKPAR